MKPSPSQTAAVERSGAEAAIIARDLHKSYRTGRRRTQTARILRGVSLQIHAGEFAAIVGPSGTGKSTLMHCLSGLEPVDSGELTLGGENLAGVSSADRAAIRRHLVGFIFQEFNLVDSLTVAQNVELSLRASGRRDRLNRVLPTLERVGIAHHRASYPSVLSGGEQQRAAVARVLAAEPPVVFADEPTGALDARNGTVVVNALHELAAAGSAVVVVTHDPGTAATADRVIELADGRALAQR